MTARYIFGEANPSDIEQLVELRVAYIAEDMGKMNPELQEKVEKQLNDYFSRKLGSEIIAYVAKEENLIVSVAYLHVIEMPANPHAITGFVGEVLNVYTRKEYRGRGLCTALMKMLIEGAKEHNISRVDLSATKAGYPVYKNVGFVNRHSDYVDMRYKLEN